MMLEATSGMNLIYISYAQTMWFKDVSQMNKFHTYYIPTMLQHMEGILVATRQLLKFCNQVTIGLLFLKMLMSLRNTVIGDKE